VDRPLRVLQLIDSLDRPGGAERSLATLAPHLLEGGLELHVGYLVERDGFQTELARAGAHVRSLAGGAADRRQWMLRVCGLISEIRPDVVHTTLFEADLAGRRAAWRMRVPCVSSLVNTAYGRTESDRSGASKFKLRAAQAADALTARRVSRFHAVTRHVAAVMGNRLMIPAHKIEVIPRGRDAAVLGRRSEQRRTAVRQRLGLQSDVPLILAVGRHEPQKGFDVLLQALPTVRSQVPDVRVLVAGREGRATPLLSKLAASAGISETVTFLGMRDDVADLMVAADVLAFPSLWEGAAGTVLEAMALECPIVSSRLATVLETIDASTAELVAPGDSDDLARGLLAALTDRKTANRRTLAAQKRFESDYTIEASAQRTAKLYRRVAAPARSVDARSH